MWAAIYSLNGMAFCAKFYQLVGVLLVSMLTNSNCTTVTSMMLVLSFFFTQSSMEEVIAATAYLELFVRKTSEPGLLWTFVNFILKSEFDGVCIVDSLVTRLYSIPRVHLLLHVLITCRINLPLLLIIAICLILSSASLL